MENKYITIKKAALLIGVSELTLRNWDNSGKFPAGRHPISNYRVYKVSDIEDLIMKMDINVTGHQKKRSRNEVRKLIVKHITSE